jgi:hypothetical protein
LPLCQPSELSYDTTLTSVAAVAVIIATDLLLVAVELEALEDVSMRYMVLLYMLELIEKVKP